MASVQELHQKIESLEKLLQKERELTSLDKIVKPSIIDEVQSFDYSFIDTLPVPKLMNYMGAWSQYLIYVNKHINQLSVIRDFADSEFKKALNIAVLTVDKKQFVTLEERKTEAQRDEVLTGLRIIADKYESLVAFHKNDTDFVSNLIQTIKKVLDARTKENFAPNAE